jgi:hypothetical protein
LHKFMLPRWGCIAFATTFVKSPDEAGTRVRALR